MRAGDKVVWFHKKGSRSKAHLKKIPGVVLEANRVRVKCEFENYGTRWVMQENVMRVG